MCPWHIFGLIWTHALAIVTLTVNADNHKNNDKRKKYEKPIYVPNDELAFYNTFPLIFRELVHGSCQITNTNNKETNRKIRIILRKLSMTMASFALYHFSCPNGACILPLFDLVSYFAAVRLWRKTCIFVSTM